MKLSPFQGEVMREWRKYGLLLLLWRRQAGKTTLFAWIAIRLMLEYQGCLVTFVSASLSVGRELSDRVASIFWSILGEIRATAELQGLKVTSNADGLDQDKFLEMFQAGKFEISIWHSKTIRSRLKIIAPNPATARGYTCLLYTSDAADE